MALSDLSPDALLDQTNLSGTVSAIQDDPDSPDGNWLTAVSDNANSVCRVSFGTPSGNPTTGAGGQTFKFWVRLTVNGSAASYNIDLYENGTLVTADIGTGTITSTTGQLLTATWDAASLGTADGSLVEAQLTVVKTGGAPSARTTGEVGAVEWVVSAPLTHEESTTLALKLLTAQAQDAVLGAQVSFLNKLYSTMMGENATQASSTLSHQLDQAEVGGWNTDASQQLDLHLGGLGENLILNSTFDNDSSANWNIIGSWSTLEIPGELGSGVLGNGHTATADVATPIVAGHTYRCVFDISNWGYGELSITIGGTESANINGPANTFTVDLQAANASAPVFTCKTAGATLFIDNIYLYDMSELGFANWVTNAAITENINLDADVAQDAVLGAATSLLTNLDSSQVGANDAVGAASLALQLDQAETGNWDAEAQITENVNLSLPAPDAGWDTDASVTENINLDQAEAVINDAAGTLTLDHTHTLAAPGSQWDVNADHQLDHQLDHAQIAGWNTDAANQLDLQLNQIESPQIDWAGTVNLDHQLDYAALGELAVAIIEAALTLGINLSQAEAEDILFEVATTLAHSLNQGQTNTLDVAAAVSLLHQLTETQLVNWDANTVQTLALSLGGNQSFGSTVVAAITLALRQHGPQGAVSGGELNPDAGLDVPASWETDVL